MNTLEDRILGALFGFAIGDAMGATTEFMTKESIKKVYGEVNEIMGGGWLNLEQGQVTDDTQMTLCVIDALENSNCNEGQFKRYLKSNFIAWYNGKPKDVGCQCTKAINHLMEGYDYAEVDNESLGNGSLMRAMPCAILKEMKLNLIQSRMTHHSYIVDKYIYEYEYLLCNILYDSYPEGPNLPQIKTKPTGYIFNTLNNSKYYLGHSRSFEEGMIEAVNDGGDADTIAAITGSLLGAKFGYDSIPKIWINQLNNDVKKELKNFNNFAKIYLQSKSYMI